jgi:16S rRNA (cytosine(967)-C(5))-methyltransferase
VKESQRIWSGLTRDSLAVAIEALSWMEYAGIGERTALFKAAAQLGVKRPVELRQAHKLIMETTRYRNRLEDLVSSSAPGKTERIAHGVTSFLNILAYLKYIANAPERDVEQNVGWARQILGWKDLLPFEKQIALVASGTLQPHGRQVTEHEQIALQTCNPTWFVRSTIQVFGRPFALRLLARNLTQLPQYVRMNTLKIHSKDRAEDISKKIHGIRLQQPQDTLRLERAPSALTRSEAFKSGEIVIQDLASIVTGFVAAPKQGAAVLELCAAPGNKTSHLAALMDNKGDICSVDISERRLSRWRLETQRMGVTIAHSILADARKIPSHVDADVVLVDPPCSNTGVFARNPNIKWKTSTANINEFASRQRLILEAAAAHVRRNGTLVYCTCTVLPEENEFVIEDFLRREPTFRLVPQTPFLGTPGLRGLAMCQRFYPHLHECNGYFIAKLQKVD